MNRKFLDSEGLLYLWAKLKSYFVKAEVGKGLSSSDYTADEKAKLAELKNYELPEASAETLGGVKVGGRLKIAEGVLSVTDGGKADSVDWSGIQGIPETFAPSTHTHGAADVTGLANVATSGSYSDLTDAPEIPTDNKGLKNGAGYQTASDVENTLTEKGYLTATAVNEAIEAKHYQTAQDVEKTITGKGYQNASQVELAITSKGYQTASDVNAAVAKAGHLKRTIVEQLPELDGADENTIYMVLVKEAKGNNRYTEWMVVEKQWEKTGDSEVDLTNYIKHEDLETVTNQEIDTIVSA